MIWKFSKVTILLLTSVVLVNSGSLAQSQQKIAVVNSQQVFENSIQGKKIAAELEATRQKKEQEIAKLDKEIQDLQQKITTQRLTRDQESILNMQADLERKNTERKRKAEDSYKEFQELVQRRFTQLQNELRPIIDQLGKEKKLDMILDLSGQQNPVIYFNDAIDLTKEVIDRYDAKQSSK